MSSIVKYSGTRGVAQAQIRPEAAVEYGKALTAIEWKDLPGVDIGSEPILSLADEPVTRGGNGRFYQAQEGWRLDAGLLSWAVCRRSLRQLDGRRFAPDGPWQPEVTRYELADLQRKVFRPTATGGGGVLLDYASAENLADALPGPARSVWDARSLGIERELLVPMLYNGEQEVITGARVTREAVTVVRCERCPRSGPWIVAVYEAALERHLRALLAKQSGAYAGLSTGSFG